jgi:hypothetical protein
MINVNQLISTPKKYEMENFYGQTFYPSERTFTAPLARPLPTPRVPPLLFSSVRPKRHPLFSFPASMSLPHRRSRPPVAGSLATGPPSLPLTSLDATPPPQPPLTSPSSLVGPPAVISVSTSLQPRLCLLLPLPAPLLLPLPNTARSRGRSCLLVSTNDSRERHRLATPPCHHDGTPPRGIGTSNEFNCGEPMAVHLREGISRLVKSECIPIPSQIMCSSTLPVCRRLLTSSLRREEGSRQLCSLSSSAPPQPSAFRRPPSILHVHRPPLPSALPCRHPPHDVVVARRPCPADRASAAAEPHGMRASQASSSLAVDMGCRWLR